MEAVSGFRRFFYSDLKLDFVRSRVSGLGDHKVAVVRKKEEAAISFLNCFLLF